MVASNGKLTTLFSFGKITASPLALIQGMDGNLYGTAMSGGTNPNISDEDGNPIGGYGTLFKMTLNGNFTVLYSFAKTNGSSPNSLTQGIDGNFYGTTSGGGAFNQGTVFRLDISSSLPDSK
jgi:uncharacterized repeat protein (TIGR03803 family)